MIVRKAYLQMVQEDTQRERSQKF